MKKIQLYESFLKKRLDDTALSVYKGYMKLKFKDYDVYIYTYYDSNKNNRQIQFLSILDKIIFVNEVVYINKKCYIDVISDTLHMNNIDVNFELISDDKFTINPDNLPIYAIRSKEDAINTLKVLDEKWNLNNIFKNPDTLTKEQQLDLAKFITENIRDISYIFDANDFDLI